LTPSRISPARPCPGEPGDGARQENADGDHRRPAGRRVRQGPGGRARGRRRADTRAAGAAGKTTWADRFGLPFAASATGYGHGSEAVAAVQIQSGELLTAYYDAVHETTIRYVRGLSDADLDRIVDKAWDPPVTLAVRLVSVISDDLQHAGQAAYLRGLIERG